MKKKLIWVMVVSLLTFGVGSGNSIKAAEGPAFLIAEDYVIINYEKYDLVDNKVTYDGLDFELIDGSLVAYDAEGVANIIPLPVEENKITDEELLAELNSQNLDGYNRSFTPSNAVYPPYTKTIPAGQWNTQSPYVHLKGGYTYLTITKMPASSDKHFTVTFLWGDLAGDWYRHDPHVNYDFGGVKNYIKYLMLTSTRYGIFTLGNLYGAPGYTYTVSISNI